jgi:diadenosine tetraphosphate (Ap4A) HIT family hydrolase
MNSELLQNKGSLRTDETEAQYESLKQTGHLERGCPLCDSEAITEFDYWKIIPNRFPYDKIASLHHMVVPKRHTDGEDVTPEEIAKLLELRRHYLNDNYQYIFEALSNAKTIPAHFHLHVMITK